MPSVFGFAIMLGSRPCIIRNMCYNYYELRDNMLIKAKHGLKFLGTELWPSGRRLTQRNKIRIANKLELIS